MASRLFLIQQRAAADDRLKSLMAEILSLCTTDPSMPEYRPGPQDRELSRDLYTTEALAVMAEAIVTLADSLADHIQRMQVVASSGLVEQPAEVS